MLPTVAILILKNGFLLFFRYHQKVPYDPPELTICEKTYGLVKPEPYEMPERSPLWTAVAYAAFDIATDPDAKEAKAKAVRFSYDKQIVKEVLKPLSSFILKELENLDLED